MEAATIRAGQETVGQRVGGSPLLRLQSDERLVALTRRGQDGAFEALVSRYQTRLLGFCRNMLGNREDAEDVLQEVFASAYTAMRADEREIMVRPWLYRIARNRSLNHMRKARPIGVDSMDIHVADFGTSTAERVHARTEFRQVMADIALLPETQRTALVLREVDGLGYEQIAEAMETTVPSVKSLLVRARVALAEHAEARGLTCDSVRLELGEVAEGLKRRISPPVRRHMKSCDHCKDFKAQLTASDKALAAMAPVGALVWAKHFLVGQLGIGGSTAGGSAATIGSAAGGVSGSITATIGAVATKAAAGVAAAALVTAGAVEVSGTGHQAATPQSPSGAAMAIPAVVEDLTSRKAQVAASGPASVPIAPAVAAIAAVAPMVQGEASAVATPAPTVTDEVQSEDTVVLPDSSGGSQASGETASGSSASPTGATGQDGAAAGGGSDASQAGDSAADGAQSPEEQVSPDAPAAQAPADPAESPTAG